MKHTVGVLVKASQLFQSCLIYCINVLEAFFQQYATIRASGENIIVEMINNLAN